MPPGMLEATFATIVRPTSCARSTGSRRSTSTRGAGEFEEQRLIAAHKAMTLFTSVPGKKRYDVVEVMIPIYSGTDASAKQSTAEGRANKKIWDRVRVTTIAAINHLATPPGGGPPTDAKGLGLTTMDELPRGGARTIRQARPLDPTPAKCHAGALVSTTSTRSPVWSR